MAYRLYSFVNHLYMPPIQWGIQTAHCVSTMSVVTKKEHLAMYEEWAEAEPTIIVCQGGNVAMLTDLFARLEPLAVALNLTCVKFHEDEQSLGGVITSVAVLVPDTLFDVDVVMETDTTQTPTKFGQRVQHFVTKDGLHTYKPGHIQHDFLSIVKNARLA